MHRLLSASLAAALAAAMPAAAQVPTAAERTAIFKAAGFKLTNGRYTRCPDDVTASAEPGSIETKDLNGDGRQEAWVKESSTFCYGNTAQAFVLLSKTAAGNWTVILDEVGVPLTHTTKHNGWVDIEVGGPGAGPFPVFQYNGTKYVVGR